MTPEECASLVSYMDALGLEVLVVGPCVYRSLEREGFDMTRTRLVERLSQPEPPRPAPEAKGPRNRWGAVK